MDLTIQQAKSIDKANWNHYVNHHPKGTAYHNFAWVESVEQAYGHQNVSLIALHDNKIAGVLPIIKMHIPFAGHFLCSLPYCDIGYALADNEQVRNALLEHLQRLKASSGAKYIEYRDTTSSASEAVVAMNGLQGKKVRMLLDLPETSEQLMNSFKSKLRSQIRKAEKNGLTYQIGNTQDLLNAFYKVFIQNMRKLGSPVHSKLWFETLRQNYKNNLLISIVYANSAPAGAGIVLRNANKACIPWASTLAEYNRLAPNMLLYWSLLKEVTDNGAKQFDFGRSTYGEGTYKFKQQWGARPLPLNWSLPGEEHLSTEGQVTSSKLRKIVERVWQKLPLGLTTMVGSRVRKYISL